MSNIVPVPAGFPTSSNGQANGASASAPSSAQRANDGLNAPSVDPSSKKAAPAGDPSGNIKARPPSHGTKPETSRGAAVQSSQKGSSTGEGPNTANEKSSVATPVPGSEIAHAPTGAANGSGAAPHGPSAGSRGQDVKLDEESSRAQKGIQSSGEVTTSTDKRSDSLPDNVVKAAASEAKGVFVGKNGSKGTQQVAKQGGSNEAGPSHRVSKKRVLESDSDSSGDNLPLSIRHRQLAKKVVVKV